MDDIKWMQVIIAFILGVIMSGWARMLASQVKGKVGG